MNLLERIGKVHFRCKRELWRNDIDVALWVEHGDGSGRFSVGQPVALVAHEPNAFVDGDPTMRLSTTAAQRLMDELWHCGLRPSEGSGSAGSLAATERHLKDMQAIAMGLLRKEGVDLPLDKPKTGA